MCCVARLCCIIVTLLVAFSSFHLYTCVQLLRLCRIARNCRLKTVSALRIFCPVSRHISNVDMSSRATGLCELNHVLVGGKLNNVLTVLAACIVHKLIQRTILTLSRYVFASALLHELDSGHFSRIGKKGTLTAQPPLHSDPTSTLSSPSPSSVHLACVDPFDEGS